ncbi:hypothetical protein ACFLWZ_03315 [Chloroflexota bacterium]
MVRLSSYEQETIINFNQGEDTAYIYTCSKSWMNHMEKVLGLKPTEKHSYAREYECPKAWIRKPHKPRRLSEEQKKSLSERLHQESILSEETPCAVGESGGKDES